MISTEQHQTQVKNYVNSYLEEGDVEACLSVLKEDMSRVLALPGSAVKIARKAIPELLALMRNRWIRYYNFVDKFFDERDADFNRISKFSSCKQAFIYF